MPLFRITKKLATALHVQLPKVPVPSDNREHEWFADIFYVERKKCVIWVHRPTLLTFVRPAVVAAELRDFNTLFRQEFTTAHAAHAFPASLFERFDVYGQAAYAPTDDRAVVGSMLDCRAMFQHAVAHDGGLARADVKRINTWLSNTPMSVLGGKSAVRVIMPRGARGTRLH